SWSRSLIAASRLLTACKQQRGEGEPGEKTSSESLALSPVGLESGRFRNHVQVVRLGQVVESERGPAAQAPAVVVAHDALARVLGRLAEGNVHLGHEQAARLDRAGQAQQEAQRQRADGRRAAEQEERQESEPDDAGRVVGEGQVAGFVEALRTLARLEGVHGAHADEERRVQQADQVRGAVGALADEHVARAAGVDVCHGRRLQEQPHARQDRLRAGDGQPMRLGAKRASTMSCFLQTDTLLANEAAFAHTGCRHCVCAETRFV
ncbi:unnamed protein product, partial [Ixodes persulcatus]